MASNAGSVFKELNLLAKNVGKLTDNQATIEESDVDVDDGDHTMAFFLYITPNDGPYRRAQVTFKVMIPGLYPSDPPQVYCQNRIYHPNIETEPESEHGNSICVNLLADDWQPEVGLDGCVMAVLFLFHNPEISDALNTYFSGAGLGQEEFEKNVRASLRGEEVEGTHFDELLVGGYSSDDEGGDNEANEETTLVDKPDIHKEDAETQGVNCVDDKENVPSNENHLAEKPDGTIPQNDNGANEILNDTKIIDKDTQATEDMVQLMGGVDLIVESRKDQYIGAIAMSFRDICSRIVSQCNQGETIPTNVCVWRMLAIGGWRLFSWVLKLVAQRLVTNKTPCR